MKLLNSFLVLSFSFLLLTIYSCNDANTNENANTSNPPTGESITDTPATELPIKTEPIMALDEMVRSRLDNAKDIDANLASAYTHEKKRYVDQSEPGNYFQVDFDTYTDADGNLAKFYIMGGEEGYLGETSYYFNKGELILEDTQESYMDELEMHQRVFFKDGEILKVEQKSNHGKEQAVDLKTAEFGTSKDYVEDAAKFAESHKNEYQRYMEYLKKAEVVKD
ncbi:MAG: hypothetical protein GY810_26785 [Aureispira sp.]|nr:hypothetical protein [Aureispira sp.]